ncbi:unnamed protein product, partial [Closterium sp. NIES-64]
PPGYYFRPGSGSGKDSWHVLLPYGGWCTTPAECKWRAKNFNSGSTKPELQASNPFNNASQGYRGILSVNKAENPRFYNWNLVMPVYCDGGGFAGRAGFKNVSGSEGVYLSGWNIIKAVLTDVTDRRGLKTASQVLLSGVSAGAEAVVTLCDQLPALVPSAKTTKCLMDSGFFLDALDRKKKHAFKKTIIRMAALHDFIGNPRCARAGLPLAPAARLLLAPVTSALSARRACPKPPPAGLPLAPAARLPLAPAASALRARRACPKRPPAGRPLAPAAPALRARPRLPYVPARRACPTRPPVGLPYALARAPAPRLPARFYACSSARLPCARRRA